MRTWKPDTCYCKIDLTNGVFITRCKAHAAATIEDVKTHNRANNRTRDGKKLERERISKLADK